MNSSSTREEGYESSSDMSEESCMFSGSHQSTLDRLYAWEKKLYEEVKVCHFHPQPNFEEERAKTIISLVCHVRLVTEWRKDKDGL